MKATFTDNRHAPSGGAPRFTEGIGKFVRTLVKDSAAITVSP